MEWYDAVGGASRAALFLPSGPGALSSDGTTVSAGTLSIANGGTGAASLASGYVRSTGSVLTGGNTVPVSMILTSSSGVPSSSTQFFAIPGLSTSATESTRVVPAPVSGTATDLYCYIIAANGANTFTLQPRSNGANLSGFGALTIASSAAAATYSITGQSGSITAGDRISISGNNAVAATAPVAVCQLVIRASQ
jgi:hypothetical protein